MPRFQDSAADIGPSSLHRASSGLGLFVLRMRRRFLAQRPERSPSCGPNAGGCLALFPRVLEELFSQETHPSLPSKRHKTTSEVKEGAGKGK
ncbi:hypothetical protein CapIbe_018630 [Capra ibex]